MKFWYLFIFLSFIFTDLWAFRVRGHVEGLKTGEMVYLYTDAPDECHPKWRLSLLMDSVAVGKEGTFEFNVQNAAYGRLWLLRTRDKPIQYFFTGDEDYEVKGKLDFVGLKDLKQTGGYACLLSGDIMDLMETPHRLPLEKRMAIEWIKKYASEDVGIWALAYYSMVGSELQWREVEEVIPFISEKQRQNPYFKILEKYHARQKLIQPGQSLSLSLNASEMGKDKLRDFMNGHPILIYAFTYSGAAFEKTYVSNAQKLAQLTQEFPDLRLVLAYPRFTDSIYTTALEQLINARTCSVSLDFLVSENPWAKALNQANTALLIDKNKKVLTNTKQVEELKQVLSRTPCYTPHYEINGYVMGLGEGVAELVYVNEDGKGLGVKDTALITNGYFRFVGSLKRPEYCNIGIRNTIYPVGFFLDNELVDVHIRVTPPRFSQNGQASLGGQVYGSKLEVQYQKLLNLEEEAEIEQWIVEHADEPLTLTWIANVLVKNYPQETLERWFKMLDKKLSHFREYGELKRQLVLQGKLQPGKIAPEFNLVSSTGDPIDLKSFRGKYLLVDFWASWCGPCRAKIPHLKKVWKDFHNRGLEILSITLDRKKKDWETALETEQMPWQQLWDEAGEVSERYNVQQIPCIILIDPRGKIVGMNLSDEQLEETLQKVLKK